MFFRFVFVANKYTQKKIRPSSHLVPIYSHVCADCRFLNPFAPRLAVISFMFGGIIQDHCNSHRFPPVALTPRFLSSKRIFTRIGFGIPQIGHRFKNVFVQAGCFFVKRWCPKTQVQQQRNRTPKRIQPSSQ